MENLDRSEKLFCRRDYNNLVMSSLLHCKIKFNI
jgi:hypothetical protein